MMFHEACSLTWGLFQDIIESEWKQVPADKIFILDAGNKKKGKGVG